MRLSLATSSARERQTNDQKLIKISNEKCYGYNAYRHFGHNQTVVQTATAQ